MNPGAPIVVASVNNPVADLVAEISAASKEQSQGVEQVNTGLMQIDQVTQSNTANAEESAAASEELSSQAKMMEKMVDSFRLSAKRQRHSRG